jgi:hypothetical protein
VASNLKRSKRTVGKKINDIDRRVSRLQRTPPARRIGQGVIAASNIAQNAVSYPQIAPGVITDISGAQATADGKNTIFYTASIPVSTRIDDIWFDIDDNYKLYRAKSVGADAIGVSKWELAVVNASNLTVGTLDASQVTVSNLDAGRITVGTLSGRRVTCTETVVSGALGITRTSVAELLANGSISANYTYVDGVNSLNYYTNIVLNKLTDQGSITCEGTADTNNPAEVKQTKILPGYVSVVQLWNTVGRTMTPTGEGPISDARLKENVVNLSESVDFTKIINNLRPVEFNFIKDKNKEVQHGFIAQEVFDVYPRAAMQGGEDPQEKPWSVYSSNLIPVLVGALQQAFAKIDDLETRLAALEN